MHREGTSDQGVSNHDAVLLPQCSLGRWSLQRVRDCQEENAVVALADLLMLVSRHYQDLVVPLGTMERERVP
jgi:hypothetical protein